MKELERLLGLGKEYKIIKVEEIKKGELTIQQIYVENIKKKVRCPECNHFTNSIHDRLKPIHMKSLKIYEKATEIIQIKRRFICNNCGKRFTEISELNEKNASITNKLKQKILKDLLNYNLSLKYISEENRVNDMTVRNILKGAMSDYPKHVKNLPRVISFDEFKADTKEGKYAFILNDPIHKKVLDILPNRKKEYLIQYFTYCENRHSVEFVISDMYEPYKLVTNIMFPKAKYVADPFHYTRYVMDALDQIRIRLQKKYGEKSKEYRLLKNKKNVSLLRKYSNDIDWWIYTKRYQNGHMIERLNYDIRTDLFKISEELRHGYYLKEAFLDIVNHSDFEHCKTEILNWIDLCRESNILEYIDASNTIENWLEEICNSFIDERFSNGFTEGMNNKIKVIKRVGFGYKNFEFFRLRLLYILRGKISGISKKDGFQKSQKSKK